jgi:hypothetical protein
MRNRTRGAIASARNPSVRWGRFALNVVWLAGNTALFLLGVFKHAGVPFTVSQAYSRGVEYATFGRLVPGTVVEWLILASVLVSVRWLILEFRAVFGGGPIEVRPLDNATGGTLDTHPLDVAFREFLKAALSVPYSVRRTPLWPIFCRRRGRALTLPGRHGGAAYCRFHCSAITSGQRR